MVSATGKTARMVPYERQYDTEKDGFAIYFGIQHLEGDGHRLFIGSQEEEAPHIDSSTYGCGRIVGEREAVVIGGQSRSGVEALAALGVGVRIFAAPAERFFNVKRDGASTRNPCCYDG